MRTFLEEHEREVLLLLVTMIAVTRWWIPPVIGFENIYCISHWVLSYDYGLVRRGLVGSVVKFWLPSVAVEDVHHTALVVFCTFLALLLVVFYSLLKHKEKNGRLFRLLLIFSAAPTTLALCARDLGRFDLFLILLTSLSFILLVLNRHLWLIPVLMMAAMFVHEAFLILWVPTIVAAFVFVYFYEKKDKRVLIAMVFSVIAVMGAFYLLSIHGTPTLGYDEFSHRIQSRATFAVTELSMRECYYGIKDHVGLASPYLHDAGSILNFLGALLMLSPVILIVLNLWAHVFRKCREHRRVCLLFFVSTLSGLLVVPIATDYGRWLSAVTFCNMFALLFLVRKDILTIEELDEFSGGTFPMLFGLIFLTYVVFGPFHDWNPYPYQDSVVYSALSMVSVLLFDVGFVIRWRNVRRGVRSGG